MAKLTAVFLLLLLSSDIVLGAKLQKDFATWDGLYNNANKPNWGGYEFPVVSKLFPSFGDGAYTPSGQERPDPFILSQNIFAKKGGEQPTKSLLRNALCAFFAEFVAHEILDQQTSYHCPPDPIHLPVLKNDTFLNPEARDDMFIPMWRAKYDPKTGSSPGVPRAFVNLETSWIDGSSVYGPSKMWSDLMRTFADGKLISNDTDGKFPGLNKIGLPMTNLPAATLHQLQDSRRLFMFGSKRANENPALSAIQTMWFREHNAQALRFARENPDFSDHDLFMLSRQFVIGEIQHIILDEWFPAFLGEVIPGYPGYSTSTPPGITPEFSIAFRWAESLVPSGINRRDVACNLIKTSDLGDGLSAGKNAIRLCNTYWDSQKIITDPAQQDQIPLILQGLASQPAEFEDHLFVEDIRQFAYGPLEFSKRDAIAMHIHRGREFGLGDFNRFRFAYNLAFKPDFVNLTNDVNLQNLVRQIHNNNMSLLDVWTGGVLETTLESPERPGELFREIYKDVFFRLRAGDRWWFENPIEQGGFFEVTEISNIKLTKFRDILQRVSNPIPIAMQDNAFLLAGDPCPTTSIQFAAAELDACFGKRELFDYFASSFAHIPLVLIGIAAYVALVIVVLVVIVRIRRKQNRRIVAKELAPADTDLDGDRLMGSIMIDKDADGDEKLTPVYLCLKADSLFVYDIKKKVYRQIPLAFITSIYTHSSSGRVVVKVPREYDLFFQGPDDDVSKAVGFAQQLMQRIGKPNEFHVVSKESQLVMKTKEMRKKEIENFLQHQIDQLVDNNGGVGRGSRDSDKIKSELLDQQLSREEFGEVFGLPRDSVFLKQLFARVDKDKTGYVSYQEFLDLMSTFYSGPSQERLKFLYQIYCTDGNNMTRDQFVKMIRSLLEINNVDTITKGIAEDAVNQLLAEAGLDEAQVITFPQFETIMGPAFGKQLQLNMQYKPKQPKGQKKRRDLAKEEPTEIDERSKTTLINKARAQELASGQEARLLTIICKPEDIKKAAEHSEERDPNLGTSISKMMKNYGDDAQARGQTITPKTRDSPRGRPAGVLEKYTAFMRDHRAHIFLLAAYIMSGALVFGERAYTYSINKEHAGLRRIAGFGVTTTRGAASAMMFNFSLLLATMCRNLFTIARSTRLGRYIPFDSYLTFHKLVAVVALFWMFVHLIGHTINFFHITTQPIENLRCFFRDVYSLSFDLPTFSFWLFATTTGFSGFLLLVVLGILYVFSTNYGRRNFFLGFWTTHHYMAILLYLLTCLHGSARLVQQPIFYIFMIPPASLFILDRIISAGRNRILVPVVEAELLPSDVTKVVYKRPDNFDYRSGQWIRIACLAISDSEYHPFTLTSAPHEKHLSNHIRAVGPWTRAFRKVYDPKNIVEGRLPHLFIDGPYGEGHQDWNSFEGVVLVGGGIGVTPFASVLKDVVHQVTSNRNLYVKKVYFMWVCRNQKQFEWLIDIIRECEQKDEAGVLETHIFITELKNKHDLRTAMLYWCERSFQKISNKSLFTGLRAITHFGRPDFVSAFSQMKTTYSHFKRIGVFSCGPPPMTISADEGVQEVNKIPPVEQPRFHHHYENF